MYDVFRAIIPYNRIGCALVDEDAEVVEAVWARSDEQMRIGVGYSVPLKDTSLAALLETGEPRIINDLKAYQRENPTSDSTRRILNEGIRSSLTCPLLVGGRPVGFLFFSCREPGAYDSQHTRLFREIAVQVSTIVEKGRVYAELADTKQRLVETNQMLSQMASVDGLTGVANRRFFDSLLEREWRRGVRLEEALSIVLIDIDHFKQYNDAHGHLAGDDCLRKVATDVG